MRFEASLHDFESWEAMTVHLPGTREYLSPPLSALHAFVAAAQYMSFSRAAEELGVTQSGVSRAIRSIEDVVGSPLFVRTGRTLVLTEPGQRYLERVRRVLADLEAATVELANYRGAVSSLAIATLPTFGSRFLVPRLGSFMQRHPDVQLNVHSRIEPFSFDGSGIDCAVHYGVDAWSGAMGDHLIDEVLVPVAAPQLIDGIADLRQAFQSLPLIQHSHRPTAWREWLRESGWTHPQPDLGVCFEQYNMGIRAALAGLGVALMPEFFIRQEIDERLLVKLSEFRSQSRWSYFLVYPQAKRNNPVLQQFRLWLRGQVRSVLRTETMHGA